MSFSFRSSIFLALFVGSLPLALPRLAGALQAEKSGAESSDPRTQEEKAENADDLLIVDCELPARVRRLGTRGSYLAPRRPLRTTAGDCRIRGGEYTEPDQANYATSLKVWLPEAQAGDAEAQYYVGQIFEKGLGTEPDYESAARWYEKAAASDYSPALVNLAYLHEMGLGVATDSQKALNLYRRAAGAAEGMVLLAESDYNQLVLARSEVDARASEVDTLESEVRELGRQLDELGRDSSEKSSRIETLEGLMSRLEEELGQKQRQLEQKEAEVARLEAVTRVPVESIAGAGPVAIDPQALAFGSYYALVIGNSEYEQLPRLERAVNDAKKVASTLENRYGFDVELLLDATRLEVMSALNTLREKLTDEDNLLIYYAGHGTRDAERNTAYWQPIDAAPNSPVNWIPNGVLADHLDLIPARHVMVVADSAFTGLRTRSSVAQLPQGQSGDERLSQIRSLLERRARLVLAAGSPTGPGERTSAFTEAFLQALDSGDGVLEASLIYRRMNQQLSDAAVSPPAFASMRWTRNEVAEFFFVSNR